MIRRFRRFPAVAWFWFACCSVWIFWAMSDKGNQPHDKCPRIWTHFMKRWPSLQHTYGSFRCNGTVQVGHKSVNIHTIHWEVESIYNTKAIPRPSHNWKPKSIKQFPHFFLFSWCPRQFKNGAYCPDVPKAPKTSAPAPILFDSLCTLEMYARLVVFQTLMYFSIHVVKQVDSPTASDEPGAVMQRSKQCSFIFCITPRQAC
jgi:hypothetical protein